MKFSTLENPSPTWKVPVAFSLTSTCSTTLESSLPGLWVTSTVSKKPSAVTRSLFFRSPVPEKSSPSLDAKLTPDDLVPGLGVSNQGDAFDVDLASLLKVEGV